MEPPVVSVIIKSDHLHRRIPRIGELVRLEGRFGLFEVVRVDKEVRIADLVHCTKSREREENVPFGALRPVSRNLAKAIEHFLES